MRPSDFQEGRSPGRLVQVPNSHLQAFVPRNLPPSWEMPVSFWPLLRDAWSTIKELNGVGLVLPDPTILLGPLEDREAIQSSRIEGTFATARELLLFEKSTTEAKGSPESRNELLEVFNYRKALQEGMKSGLPLSKRLIRELHQVLLHGVRGEDKSPGEFRRVQVGIRGTPDDPTFVPPVPLELDACLNALEVYLNAPASPYDPLVDCFLVHYQFETIHPFRDGNGRVGRLLLAIMIQQRCGLAHPWLFVSQYFEKHQSEYFDLLYGVSSRGDWSAWIEFCLNASIAQSRDTLERCKLFLTSRDSLKSRVGQTSASHKLLPIVDILAEKMFVTVSDICERFRISYPTADRHLKQLVKLDVLRPLPNVPTKMFYAPELYAVAYGDLGSVES